VSCCGHTKRVALGPWRLDSFGYCRLSCARNGAAGCVPQSITLRGSATSVVVADRGSVGSTGSDKLPGAPVQVGLPVGNVSRLNGRGGFGEALVTRVADIDDACFQQITIGDAGFLARRLRFSPPAGGKAVHAGFSFRHRPPERTRALPRRVLEERRRSGA